MKAPTYNLLDSNGLSNFYYSKIKTFSDEVVLHIESQTGEIISDYFHFIENNKIESVRSREEYSVELLTIGLLWQRYLGTALNCNRQIINSISFLNKIRKQNNFLKAFADSLKAFLFSKFVIPKLEIDSSQNVLSINNFNRLLFWLDGTGEFKDEVKRLYNWKNFLVNEPERFEKVLSKSVLIFNWFKKYAEENLDSFSGEVSEFLEKEKNTSHFREDSLLRRKELVEYHLNMIGAELMNRGFKKEFDKTKNKVLLVPGCMRIDEKNCKAKTEDLDIICSRCSEECNVYKLMEKGDLENFKVYIIPHSSSFTKWLKKWNSEPDTGLIASACLLHLVPGGYEMRELNLKAQCILLDYSGCKNHWHKKGIPTQVNVEELNKIISS